jgi:hypothetical protein
MHFIVSTNRYYFSKKFSRRLKNLTRNFLLFNYKDKNGYLTQDEFIEELGHMFQTMEAIKSFSILKKGFLD